MLLFHFHILVYKNLNTYCFTPLSFFYPWYLPQQFCEPLMKHTLMKHASSVHSVLIAYYSAFNLIFKQKKIRIKAK